MKKAPAATIGYQFYHSNFYELFLNVTKGVSISLEINERRLGMQAAVCSNTISS